MLKNDPEELPKLCTIHNKPWETINRVRQNNRKTIEVLSCSCGDGCNQEIMVENPRAGALELHLNRVDENGYENVVNAMYDSLKRHHQAFPNQEAVGWNDQFQLFKAIQGKLPYSLASWKINKIAEILADGSVEGSSFPRLLLMALMEDVFVVNKSGGQIGIKVK